jgi:hypothetical protein
MPIIGEQHVVHLGHRAPQPVLGERAHFEVLEVEAAARVANRFGHNLSQKGFVNRLPHWLTGGSGTVAKSFF